MTRFVSAGMGKRGVGGGGKGTKDPRTYRSDSENLKVKCTTAAFRVSFLEIN